MNKTVIFFIRAYNDVDHIAPIIYKLAGAGKYKILVLCQNPFFDLTADFRLKFLAREFGTIKIDYVYKYYTPSLGYRFLSFLICNKYIRKLFPGKKVYEKFYNKVIKKHFNSNWAKEFFCRDKVSLLVFDHIGSIYISGALLRAAKELKIPTIGVPNGLPLFSRGYMADVDIYKKEGSVRLDFFVEPHKRISDYRIRHGGNPDKIKIIGSARFCREWENVLGPIRPLIPFPFDTQPDKLKVVYMERGLDFHGKYKDLIKDALIKTSRLDYVRFVIKPHTRAGKLHFKEFPASITIANDIDSLNLIRWADVVIGAVSSILVDVLIRGKILLYPKFFHEETVLFEEMGACWIVNCYEELSSALKQIHSNSVLEPYPRENVRKFLGEAVYGGRYGKDVLGEYTQFFETVINSSKS